MDLDDLGDDFFDDDGLDDISAETLDALENNAIRFTQAVAQRQLPYHGGSQGQGQQPQYHAQQYQQQLQQPRPQIDPSQLIGDLDLDNDFGLEDDDLDTTEVTNELAVPVGRPVGDKSLPKQTTTTTTTTTRLAPNANRPTTAPPPLHRHVSPPRAAQLRAQASQAPSAQSGRPPGSQFIQPPLPPHAQRFRQPAQQQQQKPQYTQAASVRPPLTQHHPPGDIVSALQRRVRALEAELIVARGEVSIIRTNTANARRAHEEEVARLRRNAQEQLAERERAVEAAVAAHKTAATDLEFLRQDVREATSRAERARKQEAAAATATATTPKKTLKQWRSEAVGFDDFDVMMLSPSRRGRRAGVHDRTPGKGHKRKRDLLDSPTGALELETEGDGEVKGRERGVANVRGRGRGLDVETETETEVERGTMERDSEVEMEVEMELAGTSTAVQPTPPPTFEYLLLILDHGTLSAPHTFESLSQLSLPSAPTMSMAQLILHKLPLMGDPHQPMQLLVDFAEFAIGLWGQCYDEGVLFPAADHLVSLLSFILELHTTAVAPLVVRSLLPIAFKSLYVVAEGRSRGVELGGIDSTRVLGLLCMLAQTCASLPVADPSDAAASPIVTFWSLAQAEIVYPLFSPRQRLDDVIATLDLVATSALPGSVGPIPTAAHADHDDGGRAARILISHVSAKLIEVSRCTASPPDRHRLRLAALRTLSSFTTSEHGALAVAAHPNAIPRMVNLLCSSLDELYATNLPREPLAPTPQTKPEDNLSRIITNATLLLHALMTSPATAAVAADAQTKLAASHGGWQRFVASLTRLNFVEEEGVLEAGIGAEAAAAAHELLELAVTKEEGEEYSETFLKWE